MTSSFGPRYSPSSSQSSTCSSELLWPPLDGWAGPVCCLPFGVHLIGQPPHSLQPQSGKGSTVATSVLEHRVFGSSLTQDLPPLAGLRALHSVRMMTVSEGFSGVDGLDSKEHCTCLSSEVCGELTCLGELGDSTAIKKLHAHTTSPILHCTTFSTAICVVLGPDGGGIILVQGFKVQASKCCLRTFLLSSNT